MAYYVDVLTPSTQRITIDEVRAEALKHLPECAVILNEGSEQEWEELIIEVNEDDPVCTLSCTPFTKGESDETDLGWMLWNISECKPQSAVEWLRKYLPTVSTMYRFRFLYRASNGTDNGLTAALIHWIHGNRKGIVRAENEGYSNEDAHHILWQFSDGVSGAWTCAVLREDGGWDSFVMDLGNLEHQAAFKAGRVPQGIKPFHGRKPDPIQ